MIKNFGLSLEEFNRLVAELKRNDTTLLEQVFLAHFEDCMNYLQREYEAQHEDAYDTTMETLLLFRKRLVEGKIEYGNLRFLFTKMATQVYLKTKKQTQVQKLNIDQLKEDVLFEDKESIQLLKKSWAELGPNCKELLTWHFYGRMRLTEIAAQEQKTAIAIRKQKERCLKKLKEVFRSKSKNLSKWVS